MLVKVRKRKTGEEVRTVVGNPNPPKMQKPADGSGTGQGNTGITMADKEATQTTAIDGVDEKVVQSEGGGKALGVPETKHTVVETKTFGAEVDPTEPQATMCWYGAGCFNPQCYYRHPDGWNPAPLRGRGRGRGRVVRGRGRTIRGRGRAIRGRGLLHRSLNSIVAIKASAVFRRSRPAGSQAIYFLTT